jgi:hypothetical protein
MFIMKYTIILSVLFTCTSCISIGQRSIKGSGNVTTEKKQVTDFENLDISGVFNVILKQSDKADVTVEADDNLQQYVTVENRNNTLYVKTKEKINIRGAKKTNIYISLVNISKLKNTLVGNLSTSGVIALKNVDINTSAVGNTTLNVKVDKLSLQISAVGNTDIEGSAPNCSITNSAVGNLDAAKLAVEKMTLKNSAVGNTTVNAKTLTLDNNAVGKTKNVYTDN